MAEAEVRSHPRRVRAALRRDNLSGSFVVAKYRFSPYMACGHGCLYCDGRAERYHVEGEFDRDIVVRENLPELLAEELPRLREAGVISIGSGISDAYQPLEARLQLMRRCAEVLALHEFPVTLMTKSALVLRDLDLWKQVNARGGFMLLLSLVHPRDATRAVFEPGASTVEERLTTLRAFRDAGCATGVLAMPLLPWITDTPEATSVLYERVADSGVDWMMPGGLTLRPGRQKQFYLQRLSTYRPDLVGRYAKLYGENRSSGSPESRYARDLIIRLARLNQRHRIPAHVPHRFYRGKLHRYDELQVLLRHLLELYADRDTSRLRKALERYGAWLADRKSEYNRRRSLDYAQLDAELLAADASGELAEVIGNERLAELLHRVLTENVVYDYLSRRLVPSP